VSVKLIELVRHDKPVRGHYVLADVVGVVMALHTPKTGELGPRCGHCEGAAAWPCDTVKVVAAALGLKHGDWR
jgi:hypothetical protein